MDLPQPTGPSSPVEKSPRKSRNWRNSFVASRLVWWMPSKPWMSRKMVLSARFGLTWWDIGDSGWGLKLQSWFTSPTTHVRIETNTCWTLVSSFLLKCWGGLFVRKTPLLWKSCSICWEECVLNTWVRWHRAWYWICQGDVISSGTCFRFSCFHEDVSSNKPSNPPKKKYPHVCSLSNTCVSLWTLYLPKLHVSWCFLGSFHILFVQKKVNLSPWR